MGDPVAFVVSLKLHAIKPPSRPSTGKSWIMYRPGTIRLSALRLKHPKSVPNSPRVLVLA